MTEYYEYTNSAKQKITVHIIEDFGNMKDQKGNVWNKVIARPIGFNNSIPMILDKNKLVKV